MECFKVIGYCICEMNDPPEWLQGFGRKILSVSGCIDELQMLNIFTGGHKEMAKASQPAWAKRILKLLEQAKAKDPNLEWKQQNGFGEL